MQIEVHLASGQVLYYMCINDWNLCFFGFAVASHGLIPLCWNCACHSSVASSPQGTAVRAAYRLNSTRGAPSMGLGAHCCIRWDNPVSAVCLWKTGEACDSTWFMIFIGSVLLSFVMHGYPMCSHGQGYCEVSYLSNLLPVPLRLDLIFYLWSLQELDEVCLACSSIPLNHLLCCCWCQWKVGQVLSTITFYLWEIIQERRWLVCKNTIVNLSQVSCMGTFQIVLSCGPTDLASRGIL